MNSGHWQTPTQTLVRVRGLGKTFVLHNRDGVELPVFSGLDM